MINKILCWFGKHKYEMLMKYGVLTASLNGMSKTAHYIEVCKHCGARK